MLRKQTSCHNFRNTIVERNIWSCDPFIEPGDRHLVGPLDVPKRRRTARRHDSGRGLVVLEDVQAERTIEDRFPEWQRRQTSHANSVVCGDDLGLNRAV